MHRMPRLEGLTVLDKIRQDEDFKNIPIVIFTSAESVLKETQSYNLGADAYVVKPMNHEDLFRVARSLNDLWESVEVPEKLL